jgi:hypothetical protein
MSLQDFAQLSAIVGGLGVIASFFYVAIQIRNNTRAVGSATLQQVSNTFAAMSWDLARDSDLCNLVIRGGDDFDSLDRVEKARFRFHLLSLLRSAESAYFHGELRTLRPEMWTGIRESVRVILEQPGGQKAWTLIKPRFASEFQNYVDGLATGSGKN